MGSYSSRCKGAGPSSASRLKVSRDRSLLPEFSRGLASMMLKCFTLERTASALKVPVMRLYRSSISLLVSGF